MTGRATRSRWTRWNGFRSEPEETPTNDVNLPPIAAQPCRAVGQRRYGPGPSGRHGARTGFRRRIGRGAPGPPPRPQARGSPAPVQPSCGPDGRGSGGRPDTCAAIGDGGPRGLRTARGKVQRVSASHQHGSTGQQPVKGLSLVRPQGADTSTSCEQVAVPIHTSIDEPRPKNCPTFAPLVRMSVLLGLVTSACARSREDVERTPVESASARIHFGVSVLSRLHRLNCAVRLITPKQVHN
jgi:hypothetical protein